MLNSEVTSWCHSPPPILAWPLFYLHPLTVYSFVLLASGDIYNMTFQYGDLYRC